jgi:hypothetical protein
LLALMLIWLLALRFEAKMLVEPLLSEEVNNEPELMLMLFAETRFEEARDIWVVAIVSEFPLCVKSMPTEEWVLEKPTELKSRFSFEVLTVLVLDSILVIEDLVEKLDLELAPKVLLPCL